MNDIVRAILAGVAFIILAMALSANKDSARVIQIGLVVVIAIVVLRNENAVTEAMRTLTKGVTINPEQSSSSGGN